ncbi:hypothetical protein IMZ48_43770 [Candidatus Bathyarchaeota archaeon]|nr:hypothetical protein [Candidatus Bathyarchaeota archaeon]
MAARAQILPSLPDTVDPTTIAMSNSPTGADAKFLREIASFQIGQVGMKYVRRLRLGAARDARSRC